MSPPNRDRVGTCKTSILDCTYEYMYLYIVWFVIIVHILFCNCVFFRLFRKRYLFHCIQKTLYNYSVNCQHQIYKFISQLFQNSRNFLSVSKKKKGGGYKRFWLFGRSIYKLISSTTIWRIHVEIDELLKLL